MANALPNYLDAVHAVGQVSRPGSVVLITVAHDDDCAHWRGDPCNCNPEITAECVSTPQGPAS